MAKFTALCFVLALCLSATATEDIEIFGTANADAAAAETIDGETARNTHRRALSALGAGTAVPVAEEINPPLPSTPPPEEQQTASARATTLALSSKNKNKKKNKSPPPNQIQSSGARPRATKRTSMCQSRNLMSRGIVGGRRYGMKYFHACLNPVTRSRECCEQCREAEGCQGWFFTRLDCSAFSGSTNAGVCYLLSDALLAYEAPGTWWNGGVQWTSDQSGWNLAQDWDGGQAVAMETGQLTDSFEMLYP